MRYWLLAFTLPAAFAAAPVLTELDPRGADLGRPFTLTIAGRNLGEGARIFSTAPATFTPVLPARRPGMMAPGRAAAFLVEPKPDAAPGLYPVRVETNEGISNILLLTLGTLPEIAEAESRPNAAPNSNDLIETAEPVRQTPLVVNGTLRGPERDIFRVYGKAGERRVFEVEARRCGSAIDPVLRILDGAGKQLARNSDAPGAGLDARIDFTFPSEGNYYVEVADARFSTQAQNFYRLKMASYQYAEGIFPLGGRRGERVPVTFYGGRLSAPAASAADLRAVPEKQGRTTVALPGSPALPFLFAVSDLPELTEPTGPMPVPSVVNGRLAKEGEIDRYRIAVEPGARLLLEIEARELGTSKIEAILTAYDDKGKKLDSAGDKPLPEDVFAVQQSSRTSSDPFLNLAVPEGVREIVVTVEDLALRGGPAYAYRLIARRQAADFKLSIGSPFVNIPAGGTAVLAASADRRGWDGPIRLSVANLPPGIRAEGGAIPRETVDANNARTFNRTGILTLTADPGVEMTPRELEIWGEATLPDGSTLRRRALGSGIMNAVAGATAQGVVDRQRPVTAPWLGMELPAALGAPPIGTLEVRQTAIKPMAEGARYEFAYTWKLRGRGTPPKNVGVQIVGARDIRIIDQKPARGMTGGTFAVTTTKATDAAHYDLYLTGNVKTEDGGDELVISRPIPFEVTEGGSSAVVASTR